MTRRRSVLLALLVVAAAAATLLAMGRPPICTCGSVEFWVGQGDSPKTSQMLADWYSLSHVIHGMLFYWLLWLAFRQAPIHQRFLGALTIEAAWEVVENTPLVIDRYREATMALGYTGDSVINSLSDIAMMTLGFLMARRLPAWACIGLAMALELAALAAIRDNLALNIIMLLAPSDAIRSWQAG